MTTARADPVRAPPKRVVPGRADALPGIRHDGRAAKSLRRAGEWAACRRASAQADPGSASPAAGARYARVKGVPLARAAPPQALELRAPCAGRARVPVELLHEPFGALLHPQFVQDPVGFREQGPVQLPRLRP